MANIIYFVQIIGTLIPLVGIIALLKRDYQNRNSLFLMSTSMGCLLMNSGYLNTMSAGTMEQAMMANGLGYLGNVLFYYFFALFLVSYFWKKYPRWPFHLWAVLEACGVFIYWNDTLRRWMFGDTFLHVEQNASFEIFEIHMQENLMYMVRYSWLCLFLIIMLIYSNVRLFHVKDMTARGNLARLIGAQFVILVSLLIYLFLGTGFNFVPLLSSLAILAIILSVIADEFYGIRERGREWVFEQLEDAFIIVDKKYGYLDANSRAMEILGELHCQKNQVRVSRRIYGLFMDPEHIHQIDGRYYDKKIVEIKNKKKVVGYSMLLLDITEQHELMERVQEEKERADAANQAKSAFVSNVSHEIRTPMNAIVGMTQILLRRDLPKQERDYILNIQNSGNALLTIINDILDMSKIESGKMELVEEDYDFMAMLSDLGMIILNRIGNKPVELIFDIDKELPDKLYGDALRIRQIIINLMNNATKFTEQGSVCLSVYVNHIEDEDVELSISVRDTGQGIREEDLPKLFGSFQQVDTKKNHQKEGTGLGLSISKQLVELMHGSIGVRSEYGKGSEFYFTIHQGLAGKEKAAKLVREEPVFVAGKMRNEAAGESLQKLAESYELPFVSDLLSGVAENGKLYYFTDCYAELSEAERAHLKDRGAVIYNLQNPMLESDEQEGTITINKPLYTYNFCQAVNGPKEEQRESLQEQPSGTFTTRNAKLLVADDIEINRIVVKEMLEPLQLQIDMAENGAKALEMVQKTEYDMFLTDHFMPVMNGVEATRAIRALPGEAYQELPILMLTASDLNEKQEEYLQAGVSDFVAKPIMMEDICEKIRKWLPEEKIVWN